MAVGATLLLLALVVAPQGKRAAREDGPPPAPVEGRLLGEHDAPLAGWSIGALDRWDAGSSFVANRGTHPTALTDAHGGFRFEPRPGPAFLLVARSPDASTSFVFEDFTLDGSEIVLRTERAGGFPREYVEGEVYGPDGRVPLGAKLGTYSDETHESSAAEITGSSFRLGPLRPGRHMLYAVVEGLPPLRMPLEIAAGVVTDVGALRLEEPGWIQVYLRGAVPSRHELVVASLWRDGSIRSGGVRSNGGESGRSEPLAPGAYVLRARRRGWMIPDTLVEVVAGQVTEAELTIVPATTRTFVVRVPAADPATRLSLCVTARDGAFVWEHENTYRGRDNFTFDVEGLAPGDYRLEARSPRTATGVLVHEFTVHDLHPETGHVEIAF
jgi:hypothetical protein